MSRSRSGGRSVWLVLPSIVLLVVSILPAQAVGIRSPIWVATYAPANTTSNGASQVAAAGGRVFVGGASYTTAGGASFLTVAYDQETGTRLWARSSVNSAGGANEFRGIAASPSGSTVYVTGSSDGVLTDEDLLTIAYDAATGAKRWSSRFNVTESGENLEDFPQAIAVSRDGSRVFVVGWSAGTYALAVAYDARTGAKLWARSLRLSSGFGDVALSSDGSRVYATGAVDSSSTFSDFLTVAFNASTGATIWSKQYDGPAGGGDQASEIAASPDGTAVFVSGVVSDVAESGFTATELDWATVAYRASTGARLWAKVFAGPAHEFDAPSSVVVAPSGNKVFLLGVTDGNLNVATLMAYAAGTGATLWTAHPGRYSHMAISQDARLYLAGGSSSAAETACFSAAGSLLWSATYAASLSQGGTDVGVSPGGNRVFVIGSTESPSFEEAYLTIAYAR